MTQLTTVERTSEREFVATRPFDWPPQIVFEAWTMPEQIMRWWAPASFGISFLSCDADVRTGGSYRYVFGHPDLEEPMAFFGRYLEVVPNARIVWTNEEGDEGAITTVTFEDDAGRTLVTVRELYPSKDALDEAIASESIGAWPEQFDALDALLAAPSAGA
jgi:uncharacterized protein YndB with AHSA1/START domain